MNWCFATINGKLAEFYFEKNRGKTKTLGHAYVKKSEYKTKQELNWIDRESKKFNFVYKNEEYYDKNLGKILN